MSNPENNPSQNEQHLIRTAKPNVGFKYEVRVATLVAAMLSTNEQIKNYQIFLNLEEALPFDDVVAKVYLQEKDDPYAFAIQVKSGNDQSFGVEKYFKTWKKTVKAGGLHIVDRIDINNIHFCYFAVKKELRNFVKNVRTTKEYKLLPHNPTNEWWRLALPFEHCRKLSYDEQINETDSKERKDFIDNFYLYMCQPDMNAIEERIKEICKINSAADVLNYVDRLFENDELRESGLAKEIFETELLKIRLSDYILSPENVIQLNDLPVAIWNELTLKHDVTIVEHEENIEKSLYGCLKQMLNHLLGEDVEWNEYERKNLNSTIISKFKELFTRKKPLMVRHWISPPTTLKELIIELWKYGKLPLILKTEEELSVLKAYAHLHKKYIIITKKLISRREEIDRYPLSVFTRISDVNKCLEVRDELLRAISVSIHGRKPITLYSMVNGHEELTETLSCAHILHLMKTREAYLTKECLDVEHDMIFLINDPNSAAQYSADSINKIRGNTAIMCRPDEITRYREEIEETAKLEGYGIYHCTASSENENFILNEGNEMLLRDFFVDQYGESVYNLESDIVPILGNNFRSIQQDYIPRFLCNDAIVSKSLFNSPTKGICFFSGDLTCLDVNIRKHILELSLDAIEENMHLSTKNHFIKVKSEDIDNYWKKISKLKRPLLHIHVEGSDMHLSKCKNWIGLSNHISFNDKKIPEERFLTELTGRIIVVTGEPGIGKSALLRSLFKNHGLEKYILFYNLTDYKEKEKNKLRDINSSLDFILNKVTDRRYSEFLSNLFKRKEKLLVVLDSFDEVLPSRKDDILNFIRNLVENNIQIIIASRLITNYILMDNFEINIFKVDILNEENRKEYIRKCKLGEEMLTTIPPEFLENPLYLNLLKLISQNGVHLPDVSKFALFENIVRIKLNEYFKKFFSSDLESDKECYLEPVLEKHFKLALVRIVGVNAVEKLLGWTCEKQLSNQMKLGIILSIDGDGYPTFVHETFAEYLTAAWIVKNKNEISAKEIYMEMLNQNKMYVLDILCDHIELHKAVLMLDREKIEMYSNDRSHLEKTDALGRTALHVFTARYHNVFRSFQRLHLLLYTIISSMHKLKVNYTDSDDLMEWNWVQYINKGNHINYILDMDAIDSVPLLEVYVNCIVQKLRAGVKLCIVDRPYYDAPKIYKKAIKACSIDLIRDFFFIEDIALNGISQANIRRQCRALETYELNSKEINGLAPLHVACIYGNVDAVSKLVNIKHDVNVTDNFGCTPLHYSVMHPLPVSVDITKILIENGAKIDVANKWKDIAIYIAVRSINLDLTKLLLQKLDTDHSRGTEVVRLCLLLALQTGDRNMIELLLEYQPDADIVSEDYFSTLLFFSIIQAYYLSRYEISKKYKLGFSKPAKKSNLDCMKLLLESGANANGPLELATLSHIWTPASTELIESYELVAYTKELAEECRTPLMLASAGSSSDLTMLLLEKGASVNSTTTDGKTALMFASEGGCSDVAELLLEKNASVDATTVYGDTALMYASRNGSLKIAKLLIEKGASVNSTTINGETPLMFASARGSSDITQLLIEKGASVNSTTINGKTPLMFASARGSSDITQLLIEKGASVNSTTTNGKTALMFTSTNNSSDAAKLLIENGANVNSITTNGRTALMIATERGKSNVAKFLIEAGANVDTTTVENETALTFASENGNLEITALLLTLGVDVNSTTTDGRTPLMLAAEYGRVDFLKLLLEKGADVNSTTIDGRTPLMFAFRSINSDAAKLLLENGATVNSTTANGETSLMLAIQCKHRDIAKLLLEKGADINAITPNRKTLLMFASEVGRSDVVELLLEKGTDINSTTLCGKTALIFSIEKGKYYTIPLLLEKGADVNSTTTNGKTPLIFSIENMNLVPLMLACLMGFSDPIKLLLEKGADVNHITTNGRTPLFFAIEQTDTRAMVLLLQRGANINSMTSNGETPLFYALKRGSIKTVKLLLEHGVDVNRPVRYGKTPLYYAIERGRAKVVKLLLEYGADVNGPARRGKTPLYFAIEQGCVEIMEVLLEHGADVNRSARHGKTPLYFAIELERVKATKFLLEHSAVFNKPIRHGKTPPYYAIERNCIKLVKLLLKHGADVNRPVKDGKMPLYFAVERSRIKLVKLLLKHGTDVNRPVRGGKTPLYFAVERDRVKAVKLLLQYGADVSTLTYGKTSVSSLFNATK